MFMIRMGNQLNNDQIIMNIPCDLNLKNLNT
jgi:hypothetical protein